MKIFDIVTPCYSHVMCSLEGMITCGGCWLWYTNILEARMYFILVVVGSIISAASVTAALLYLAHITHKPPK